MTTLAVWLFAGSAGLVLYAYVGYPLLLFALGKVRSEPVRISGGSPSSRGRERGTASLTSWLTA